MDLFAAMRAFVRIIEAGSFSVAARQLGLSRSMISRQIATLEADLGVRLLQRTTRAVALTEAGQGYADHCRKILAEVDEARQQVSQLQAVPRGRLRVNAPASFSVLHLLPLLPIFLDRCPEVALDLTMSDRFVDVIEGGFDAVVRIGRLGDTSLVGRRLAPISRRVVGSPDYFTRHGTPHAPEDLADHDCLSHETSSAPEWRFVGADGKMEVIGVRGRCRANNGDALRAFALAGLGLAYLPSFFLGDDIRADRLIPVLDSFIPEDMALYALYPAARHLSPKVRAFIDFLVEKFSPLPPWDVGLGDVGLAGR